jgi:multidrug efflux pump subunit AcrA (membrane-fusion protein)
LNGYATTLQPANGRPDAGQRDAGQRDAGQRDAGQRDAGQRDAGQRDAGQRDPRQQQADRPRQHITRPQRIAAALIAGACVVGAAWYVPEVLAADGKSLSGTVTSSGVVYLNFSSSGQLATINAHVGQQVRKGELLATEVDPAVAAVLAADRAAIAADKSELAAAQSAGTTAAIDTARAQLARDEGQLAVDRADAAGTRIVAPSAGTVIAVNGEPGETADAEGIRDYSSEPQGTSLTQRPLFSLFPDGPQASTANSSDSVTSAPIIGLRTSDTWQVTVLVPEASVANIKAGQDVTIDVPAADITGVPGRIQELLATPVATSQGTDYEAVVTVLDPRQISPPSGMAANVQLGS